ncbi:MAG TPA: Holliday junction resolvase RuvX [Candidatus Gracilibacteria bacterium]|nr:Holliday junction resolvase RuvX [Candidatus Gracilibacteria bacterium]
MKILALDWGEKYIGLALSDQSEKIAFRRPEVLNNSAFLAYLSQLVQAEKIEKIILGQPQHLWGEMAEVSQKVNDFVMTWPLDLQAKLELVDERWTSRMAERNQQQWGKKSDHKKRLDSASAQILLENYLQRKNK